MSIFDEIDYRAPDFGDLYDELPLWSAQFGRMLLEQVPMQRGMTIVDVGAGTGFLTIELAQRCGADSTVFAVDPWQAALKRLDWKRTRLGLNNIQILQEDIATTSVPDSSADLIVSNLGINNFDDPDAAIRACYRIAKPGASLYFTTNLVGHMAEFYEVYRATLVDLGLQSRLESLDRHIHHRATVASTREQLERGGFAFVDAITGAFQERFADGTTLLRHFFVRLAFVSGWKSIVQNDERDVVFELLQQRLNTVAAQTSGLSLTIPMACIRAKKAV